MTDSIRNNKTETQGKHFMLAMFIRPSQCGVWVSRVLNEMYGLEQIKSHVSKPSNQMYRTGALFTKID